MGRCEALTIHSQEPDKLTRGYGTAALRATQEEVATWMEAAGLTVRRDAVGNLIGRYEGKRATAKTLLLGSHLDSVGDAGKYDGPLGVLVALAVVEGLHARQERLPFAIELLAFADEEGMRFGTAYLGSSVFTGAFDSAWLTAVDTEGVSLADAILGFGGDPDGVVTSPPDAASLAGYVEVHIEQGPTLESLDLPVGIVSAIAGRNRVAISFTGAAGHAGTVAMPLRHDALCAAAEFVLAAEATALATPGLVATVGEIAIEPGAGNVIPGLARLALDIRHPDDTVREGACRRLRHQMEEMAVQRGVEATWQIVNDNAAVACDPHLSGLLADAIEQTGHAVHHLPSGAGHDPVMLAVVTSVAMLFVRCAGGISHNPAESVMIDDVAVAIEVVDRFVGMLADVGPATR